jgi:hypothetical protein
VPIHRRVSLHTPLWIWVQTEAHNLYFVSRQISNLMHHILSNGPIPQLNRHIPEPYTPTRGEVPSRKRRTPGEGCDVSIKVTSTVPVSCSHRVQGGLGRRSQRSRLGGEKGEVERRCLRHKGNDLCAQGPGEEGENGCCEFKELIGKGGQHLWQCFEQLQGRADMKESRVDSGISKAPSLSPCQPTSFVSVLDSVTSSTWLIPSSWSVKAEMIRN